MKGVHENDFAMVLGYPGSTDRYLTSYGVKEAVEIEQPARVKIRRMKLDIMEEGMDADPAVRLQYASKHAGVANYWKYFLGQSQQLVNNKVYDKKLNIENDFSSWLKKTKETTDKYQGALPAVEKYYAETKNYVIPKVYYGEAIARGPEVMGLYLSLYHPRGPVGSRLAKDDANEEEIGKITSQMTSYLPGFYKDYNAQIDENLLAAMLELYYNDVPKEFHPQELTDLHKKCKGDWVKFASKYFKKSPIRSLESMEEFLNDFSIKQLKKDPIYNLTIAFYNFYVSKVIDPITMKESKFDNGMRLFVDGLRKMNPEKAYASDANSTMRLTYGNVLPYEGKDAVKYHFLTTLEGVMEKEVVTDVKTHEFYVEPRLKELYNNKDYGQYALPNGKLPVGFLTNNDITGGNSGSPVINGEGHLIGTAFDGNWEAMSGDIYFEPNLQRCISVDIRYTLFVIDKFAGAGHIVDEMTLIK